MLKEVPLYWQHVLQGIAHWISYKKQYYSGHLLTEGAITAEISQLIAAHLDDTEWFECEKMYKDLDPSLKGQTRIDLVVGKLRKVGQKKERIDKLIHSAIELKRFEKNEDLIKRDFEKLWRLKKKLPHIRLFEIVIGQGKLPGKLFSDSFNIKKNNIYEGKLEFNAIPRMGKKSFNTKRKLNTGNYAVLIELVKK